MQFYYTIRLLGNRRDSEQAIKKNEGKTYGGIKVTATTSTLKIGYSGWISATTFLKSINFV